MSRTTFDHVVEFHRAFQVPQVAGEPSLDAIEDRIHLRMSLVAEEFIELVESVYGRASAAVVEQAWENARQQDEQVRNLVGVADALGDLSVVINGFAIEANIPLDNVIEEIHRSNMSKLGADGKPVVSDGVTPDKRDGKIKPKGKVLKGPNFSEPDLKSILHRG